MSGHPGGQSPAPISTSPSATPGHLTALIRHFDDLRDNTHGGSVSRHDKEAHFARAVELIAPVAHQALGEINTHLLLDSGSVVVTGLQREADGSLSASWELAWPEQQAVGVAPVTLLGYYGIGFHHPHLRGATVGDWPLNVFTVQDAGDQLPMLRAIVAADLHNLVFQADYRIIPAVMRRQHDPPRRSS
ncbi:MAG: uncharacterized protein JWP14_1769 [Frankiales bacterium]|jgi:hypothetical protein|nr:uncharacterized protein [Frankiales bacterium]